jgi:hypothetical protein
MDRSSRFAQRGQRALLTAGALGALEAVILVGFFTAAALSSRTSSSATSVAGAAFWLGTLSDIVVIPQVLLLAVAALALSSSNITQRAAAASCALGAVLMTLAQVMLLARIWRFDTNSQVTLPAIGLIGIWVAASSWAWLKQRRISRSAGWFGFVIGLGSLGAPLGLILILALGGSLSGTPAPPAEAFVPVLLGGLCNVLGLPVWAIWAGLTLARAAQAVVAGQEVAPLSATDGFSGPQSHP